jgi:cytoskeletal protein RodZ
VESLGNKLKSAREDKGYTCEYVSRETNIAVRYLEALEREEFSSFPGEPYLLGFLKNYGEFLGIPAAELLSLYRALKIQEQPVPVEQLLRRPSPLPRILLGAGIGILILGAAAGVYFLISRLPRPEAPAVPAARSPVERRMGGASLQERFYLGDSILIPSGADQYKLELSGLGETVTVTTPEGAVILDLGQEVTVDLNRDGLGELRIAAADFVKYDSDTGALLRFELDSPAGPLFAEEAGGAGLEGETAGLDPAAGQNAGTAAAPVTIFSSANPYPFTLQASFQGYCMFRWEVLNERDRRERNERYYQRSDELNIQQIQNGIRVWSSNALAAKIQVTGGGRTVPLELGAAGEVVAADIRWVRDEDNRFRLALVRLD